MIFSLDKISGYRSRIINALIDAVRSLRIVPGPGLRAAHTPGGTLLTLAPTPPRHSPPISFQPTLSGNVLTIAPGSIRYHGIGNITLPETTLTCAISPMWASLTIPTHINSTTSPSLIATSTEPKSDYSTLYLPLCTLIRHDTPPTHTWEITQICHLGDFNFYLPLR